MTWFDMRSLHYSAAAIVCMALISLAAAAIWVGQIERLTRTGVQEALLSGGMGWAEVRVDGLRVILSGIAPDKPARLRARGVADRAADSALVIDEMGLELEKGIRPPQFPVEFLRNDGIISMIGVVPATFDRMAMAAKISNLTDGGEVKDLLDSADYPAPPGWKQAVEYGIEVLGQLPWSSISVRADRVEVRAISDSPRDRGKLEARLRRRAPEGVALVLDISAPRPVIAPFILRFRVDGNVSRLDACSAHTESGSERIVSAAVQAGLKGRATCRVGLGAPGPQWADAAVAGIRAIERLGAGSVTFSDTEISLVAPAEIERAQFDRVVRELDATLPDMFSITAMTSDSVLVMDTSEESASALSEFVATFSPEGVLHLKGRMTNESLLGMVEGYARALFANADVRSMLRLDTGLPNGWAERVFAGLEALSQLVDGHLQVQPELLSISGRTHDPNASDEISRSLSAALGAAEAFVIDVSYVALEEPASGLPTPQECVRRINAILEGQQIGFEPGSADIGQHSFEVIDRIGEAMDGCSEFEMEIGGHTDSQGSEAMNLRLSQERAEAVLSALQSRQVLSGNLRPVGYGETRPIADNDTEAGREANRRIEFTLATDAVEEAGEDNGQN